MKEDLEEVIKNTFKSKDLFIRFMAYTKNTKLIASFQNGDEKSKREWENLRAKIAKFPKTNRYESFLLLMFLN